MNTAELEQVFAETLQQKIKEQVKGKVFVKVVKDQLIISIECWHDIRFKRVIDDFSGHILNGFGTDDVCKDIVKAYKAYVIGAYFK